jgi:hypothetical protein
MVTVHVEEPNAIDLARFDDDGGGSPAGSERRQAREGSPWKRLALTLRRFLIGR